jgi:hypothetical protein
MECNEPNLQELDFQDFPYGVQWSQDPKSSISFSPRTKYVSLNFTHFQFSNCKLFNVQVYLQIFELSSFTLKYLCFWSSKQVQELNLVETQNLDMETQGLGACFRVLNLNSNEWIFYPIKTFIIPSSLVL